MGPLTGIRVTDFTWALAGPYATELMAFLGAEVIKIETSKRLDLVRGLATVLGWDKGAKLDVDKSAEFNECNLNKLGVRLDLTKPEAVAIVKKLVSVSDVVAENFSPGVIEKLGLGYDVLKEIKKDIVMLSSSAVGATGPEKKYLGFATVFLAVSGLAHLSGYPDYIPGLIRAPIDATIGSYNGLVLMAALNHRQTTGEGQHIDVSSREVISSLVGDSFINYSMNGVIEDREGNRDEIMAPHNCYRCRGVDRWVSIAVGSDKEWRQFCKVLGNPGWSKDARFQDMYSRWLNQEELDKLIDSWTINYNEVEITERMQKAGVAAFPSMSSQHLWEDRHLKGRNFYVTVDHPKIGKQVVAGPPWKFSRTPTEEVKPGPLLGQHEQYVFGELLGMSSSQIADLEAREIII